MVSGNMSPNLRMDQEVGERRAQGESIVHLGLGESRLPVFPPLLERLAAGGRRNSYGPVAGSAAARRHLADYFGRRCVPTHPDQVILAPGSKPLLMALQMVVPGDVVVPCPSWVTYAPQAELAGKRVWGVGIPPGFGGAPSPEALSDTVREARARGGDPRMVILTLPDNPTGTTVPPAYLAELCAVAEREDLLIVSDEIYRDLVHDPEAPFLSPAELVPERTVVITGLSKSLALGGWRIGAARFPDGERGCEVGRGVTAVASEVWSTLANPMQAVAEYAYAEPPELRDRLAADARLHARVAGEVHRLLTEAGVANRKPTGGFYCYPDFEPFWEPLSFRGVNGSADLERFLLDEFKIAVLSGHHFGDDPRALRVRMATSMLYGDTQEEQEAVLNAADPLLVEPVASSLTRIRDVLVKVAL